MHLVHWMTLRVLLAFLLSLGVWDPAFPLPGSDSIWILLTATVVVILVQMGVTVFADIVTLRRGQWKKPSLRSTPWQIALPVASPFLTLLLLFIGVMLIVSSFFMGVNRIVAGLSCLLAALLLHGGQVVICKIFASRINGIKH